MSKKSLGLLVLLISLIVGGVIVGYYWMNSTFEAIANVPMYLMILSLVYVLAQILKRTIIKQQYWWDWLYYIGLAAVVLPTFFATRENASMFHLFTDIGTIFLIIPLILDAKQLISKKS